VAYRHTFEKMLKEEKEKEEAERNQKMILDQQKEY
jgi:hypothetical protein